MSLWLPEEASSFAADMDWLIIFITVIVGVWLLAAEALLVYSVIRFRRRPGVRAAYLPARSLRSMLVVLVPCAVILVFDLVIDAVAAPVWTEIKETLPEPDELLRITGQQWMWHVQYAGPDGQLDTPDDFRTINELRVPMGAVVQFQLTSLDVLHSFWIRELRLKQDAVPGRVIRGWFKATKEGSWELNCAEICGIGHTMMKGMFQVMIPGAYATWRDAMVAATTGAQEPQG